MKKQRLFVELTIPSECTATDFRKAEYGEYYVSPNAPQKIQRHESESPSSALKIIIEKTHRPPHLSYILVDEGHWKRIEKPHERVGLRSVERVKRILYMGKEYEVIITKTTAGAKQVCLGYWNDGIAKNNKGDK